MSDVTDWGTAYLAERDTGFAALPRDAQLSENLFTSGRLDSMGLMTFLLDAEARFGFTFTPESFQDRRLQTIAGLGAVVAELKGVS